MDSWVLKELPKRIAKERKSGEEAKAKQCTAQKLHIRTSGPDACIERTKRIAPLGQGQQYITVLLRIN
jgi:hypothetical protein